MSGCECFTDIAEYGRRKLEFLRRLSDFANGTPSHDTLSTVFRAPGPEAFARWVAEPVGDLGGRTVAVDGKSMRGSKAGGVAPLHMISAWCDGQRLVLGQRPSASKGNGIGDIPELLELLQLEGAIVTIDAMGCPRAIAEKIRDRGADYTLALKANQGTLHEDVMVWFGEREHESAGRYRTVDGDRGRIRTRAHSQCADIGWPRGRHSGREGPASIGRVVSTRKTGGETTVETRYLIPSLPPGGGRFAHAVRPHRGTGCTGCQP